MVLYAVSEILLKMSNLYFYDLCLCLYRVFRMFRELEQAYSTKQVALSVYSQKAQETVDKIFQVSCFIFFINKAQSKELLAKFRKWWVRFCRS
jgi:hypothetical protein